MAVDDVLLILAARLTRRGGLTSRLLMLRGRELKAMYASCR
ncbi:MAG: hypothetical protein E6719_04600 [Dermabacter sp.]|nr:hypothetical protein [Dermabacter sp.]